jgi:hypothetical protein
MPLRPFLNGPTVRLVLDTAAAILALPAGLEIIAHAGGSTWAPLIGGPVITLAGARLIFLARLWYRRLKPEK